MKVGDRARSLMRSGVDRYSEADLAATRVTVTHRHGVSMAAASAVAIVALLAGCIIPDNAKIALGIRAAPTEIDHYNQHILASAGIDAHHPVPSDLAARLALPSAEVHEVAALIQASNEDDLAIAGVLDDYPDQPAFAPTRIVVLRDFLGYLRNQPHIAWPQIMAEIQLQRSISDRARAILAPFAKATELDTAHLGTLIERIMALSINQREALYRAGFPAVPADPERALLFARLPYISDIQKIFLYGFLTNSDMQAALVRTAYLLHSQNARATRAALGILADGGRLDGASVPRGCDVVTPRSCLEAR